MKQKYRVGKDYEMDETELIEMAGVIAILNALKGLISLFIKDIKLRYITEVSLIGTIAGERIAIYIGEKDQVHQYYRVYIGTGTTDAKIFNTRQLVNMLKDMELPIYDEDKIYLLRKDTDMYKLHYLGNGQYSWIDMGSSRCFANGFFSSGEKALQSYKNEYVVLDNQSSMIQWLYINR